MFNDLFDTLKGRQPKIIGSEKVKHAAVVIPLVEKDEQWYVLFEVRAQNMRRQPGEICFPGGRLDEGEDFKSAALREVCEELQVSKDDVHMIAPMDVNLSVSGQMVVPYLAVLTNYNFTWNKDEVETVFLVPLPYFLETQPAAYKNHIYTQVSENFPLEKIPGGRAYPWHTGEVDVYFYDVPKDVCYPWDADEHRLKALDKAVWTIWGLTARIMHATVRIIKEKEIYR